MVEPKIRITNNYITSESKPDKPKGKKTFVPADHFYMKEIKPKPRGVKRFEHYDDTEINKLFNNSFDCPLEKERDHVKLVVNSTSFIYFILAWKWKTYKRLCKI